MTARGTTGKRQRPLDAVPVSPLPPPRPPLRDDDTPAVLGWKKRRVRNDATVASTDEATRRERGPVTTDTTPRTRSKGKRPRSATLSLEDTSGDLPATCDADEDDDDKTKRRRMEAASRSGSPRASLSVSPRTLPREIVQATTQDKRAFEAEQEKRDEEEEEDEEEDEEEAEEEEKARFPPSPIVIPCLPLEEEEEEEDGEVDIPKENRRDAMDPTVDECLVSSQGSDADLVAACANLPNDGASCSHPESHNTEVDRVRHGTLLRSVQVTPPPSARMLDRKNPPPPPQRPKRRNYGGIVYARTYPRLALSPLVDNSPPNSPRVFRSLENEFAFAMQDTPEIRPRVRPAPRMARGSRRSTRAGCSRARRSLDTPTSTMVLRSRQLNPSLSVDGGKPENQREREQRDAQRRQ